MGRIVAEVSFVAPRQTARIAITSNGQMRSQPQYCLQDHHAFVDIRPRRGCAGKTAQTRVAPSMPASKQWDRTVATSSGQMSRQLHQDHLATAACQPEAGWSRRMAPIRAEHSTLAPANLQSVRIVAISSSRMRHQHLSYLQDRLATATLPPEAESHRKMASIRAEHTMHAPTSHQSVRIAAISNGQMSLPCLSCRLDHLANAEGRAASEQSVRMVSTKGGHFTLAPKQSFQRYAISFSGLTRLQLTAQVAMFRACPHK